MPETAKPRHHRSHKEMTRKATKRWRKPVSYDEKRVNRVLKVGEDGAVKKPRKFKTKTLAKHRTAYYTTGQGAEGIKIRRSRTQNWTRKLMNENVEALGGLLSNNGDTGKWLLWKSYVDPVRGALDALTVELMAIAYSYAKARHPDSRYEEGKEAKKPHGVKLTKSDLRNAIHWYRRIKLG